MNVFAYFLKPTDNHVRISRNGRYIINNRSLAAKVVKAIDENKGDLQKGKTVAVGGTGVSLSFIRSLF